MHTTSFTSLPLSAVVASTTNPRKRFNEKQINELAASIKVHGVMQPILVRPINKEAVMANEETCFRYEVVAGERRLRASKLAGVDSIPAMISELDDLETLQLQIIENAQREDLHPMEEAHGFKALLDNKDAKSWDADKLAEKIGKSKSHIYSALKLTELCTYAQDMFLEDKFGRETAVMIARIPGEKLQTQATKEVIKGNGSEPYSFRVAKQHIHNRYTLSLIDAKFSTTDTKLLEKAGACFSCPKRSGNYPELFNDIESADVCTDPDCFAAKKAAHIEVVISQHKRVLQGEEAKKVMPHGVNYGYTVSGYAKANDSDTGLKDGKSWTETLSGDMPEPIIIVDENNNYTAVFETTALQQKLEQKITSGELVVQPSKPVEKQDWEIKREAQKIVEDVEEARRLALFNKIQHYIPIAEPNQILRMAIDSLVENSHTELEPILNIYGFESDGNSQSEQDFISQFQSTPKTQAELLKLIALLLLVPVTSVGYNWEEKDNETDDDYQRLISFVKNTGADLDQFLNSETASTPPIAAHAKELDADEKPVGMLITERTLSDNDLTKISQATLPPKLQAIKDAELAKRARKALKASKDVSANADALNPALAEPAQTNE